MASKVTLVAAAVSMAIRLITINLLRRPSLSATGIVSTVMKVTAQVGRGRQILMYCFRILRRAMTLRHRQTMACMYGIEDVELLVQVALASKLRGIVGHNAR